MKTYPGLTKAESIQLETATQLLHGGGPLAESYISKQIDSGADLGDLNSLDKRIPLSKEFKEKYSHLF